MSDTFIDEVLSGTALWTDIESWVRDWHNGNGSGQELHEYLGMTWPEYQLWVERPAALRMIIAAREHELPVEAFVADFDEWQWQHEVSRGQTYTQSSGGSKRPVGSRPEPGATASCDAH